MRLVLDNLDSLQRPRDTVVIKRLQEFARQCAEQDLVSVVFAFGPGDMLETMQSELALEHVMYSAAIPSIQCHHRQCLVTGLQHINVMLIVMMPDQHSLYALPSCKPPYSCIMTS